MTARTYDPFAIERPMLKLGSLGEWELGEFHDTRSKRFEDWYKAFQELSKNDEVSFAEVARTVGELISVSCLDAADAPDIVVDMCDAEKHGEDARGLQTLKGIVQFLVDWAASEDAAGEP